MTGKVIALLPMKANSERVVGKNFRDFCGRPLFRWVLDTLLDVSQIDKVVINTDARDILEEHGVIDEERVLIRDRPSDICGDLVSMNEVLRNDVENVDADIFLMTHTTNPLLSKESIEMAIKEYSRAILTGSYDSMFSVTEIFERFYDRSANAINHDPNNLIRTQDLEPWYQENSNFYLFTRESFESTGARIGLRPRMFVTQSLESIDIDTPEDWTVAEAVAASLTRRG